MKSLRRSAGEFVAGKRSLGYKIEQPARYLQDFVSFMGRKKAGFITSKLALEWAMRPKQVTSHTWSIRLRAIRQFARYRILADRRTEIPSTSLLSSRYRRRNPYIYSNAEVGRLLRAAKSIPSPLGLERHTMYTAVGLVASTGLRRRELIMLNQEDADLKAGVLKINMTKFGKSRLVPLHPTVTQKLRKYAQLRNAHLQQNTNAFFITEFGTRISRAWVHLGFVAISRKAGLRGPTDSFGPRLHDLRHRFSVNTLIGWLRDGADIDYKIPALSTYLGHTNPTSTYWYFSCVPELMRLAQAKMERTAEDFT